MEDLAVSSRLAALEMLRTGTTTVLTHDTGFLLPDYEAAFIEPMAAAGIRQLFARMFLCRTPKRPKLSTIGRGSGRSIRQTGRALSPHQWRSDPYRHGD